MIIPPLMEGVRSIKGHMGLRSRVLTHARVLAILQPYPHVRVSLQHMMLRKKVHKVHMRYLASEIHADILA